MAKFALYCQQDFLVLEAQVQDFEDQRLQAIPRYLSCCEQSLQFHMKYHSNQLDPCQDIALYGKDGT